MKSNNLQMAMRQKMEELGISQGELSRKTNISQALISTMLKGIKNPGIQNVSKIAAVLNISLDELYEIKPSQKRKIPLIFKNIQLNKTNLELINSTIKKMMKDDNENHHSDSGKLADMVDFIITELTSKDNESSITLFQLIETIDEIYNFSASKNEETLDKHFASWYIRSYIDLKQATPI